jgi:hypothetical protein
VGSLSNGNARNAAAVAKAVATKVRDLLRLCFRILDTLPQFLGTQPTERDIQKIP